MYARDFHCGGSREPISAEDAANEIRDGRPLDRAGGSIRIAVSKGDTFASLTFATLRLTRVTVRPNNKLDDEAGDAALAGVDDKIFRVDRSDIESCARLATNRNELTAIRHK